MAKPLITVIDYGLGNLLSVQRGLEYCGAEVICTSSPSEIIQSDRLVLPGVGAYGVAMRLLNDLGLVDAIKCATQRGSYLLGICLGMQLLLDKSEEFDTSEGFGLIRGSVGVIPNESVKKERLKIPHVGWNNLISSSHGEWNDTVLSGVSSEDTVYFVHSFMVDVKEESQCIAYSDYGGVHIPSVIQKKRIVGCQFHPEKSGEAGLKILKNFVSWSC